MQGRKKHIKLREARGHFFLKEKGEPFRNKEGVKFGSWKNALSTISIKDKNSNELCAKTLPCAGEKDYQVTLFPMFFGERLQNVPGGGGGY